MRFLKETSQYGSEKALSEKNKAMNCKTERENHTCDKEVKLHRFTYKTSRIMSLESEKKSQIAKIRKRIRLIGGTRYHLGVQGFKIKMKNAKLRWKKEMEDKEDYEFIETGGTMIGKPNTNIDFLKRLEQERESYYSQKYNNVIVPQSERGELVEESILWRQEIDDCYSTTYSNEG